MRGGTAVSSRRLESVIGRGGVVGKADYVDLWLEGGAKDMLHGRRRLLECSCDDRCGLFYKVDGRNAGNYGLD